MHSIANFARNFAQRKNAQHSKFRNEFRETPVCPKSDEEDDEAFGEDDVRDPLLRTAGRVRVAPEDQPAIPGGSKAGYAYQPHTHGKNLVGWRIKATFPTRHRPQERASLA
jgi:hypothetical protein